MKPRISVIIPIYNTEKYLAVCIESILEQTFEDFELILVNDGSTDESLKICECYQKSDSRIKIVTKKNGGISSARNAGLESAVGKYLVFVDSDDYVECGFLERAYKIMMNFDVDLYMGGFCEVHEMDGKKVPRCIKIAKQYSVSELLDRYEVDYPGYWISLVWGKMYRTDIIQDMRLRFDPLISYKEDALFMYSYLRYTKQVYFDSQVICNYRMLRKGSLNLKIHADMYEINCKVYKLKRELMIENGCSSDIYNQVYFGSLMNSIEYFYMSDRPECKVKRYKTITAVCESEILSQICVGDITSLKRKLMFVLCRMKTKRIIAAIFWVRSRIRG